MTKQTYFEKLKDPRWQRKRLEIMKRDGFCCRCCGEDSKTLNVHHKTYRKGAEPWEYEDENFTTLCEPCHLQTHDFINDIKKNIRSSVACRDLVLIAILREIDGSRENVYVF